MKKAGGEGRQGGRPGKPAAVAVAKAVKKEKRVAPRTTLQRNLPEIAAAMAERAKAGSYLHARALQDLVEASEARRGRTRGEKRLVSELLERLENLSCGCGRG